MRVQGLPLSTARRLSAGAALALLSGCAAGPAKVPPGMQYLFGSGEAAALSEQAFQGLVDHVRAVIAVPAEARQSAVLVPAPNLDVPRTLPCADRPAAVIFDMDETAILNLGYEYDDARHGLGYDDKRWQRWEQTGAERVEAVPGAAEAFAALRGLGVTPVINTNRTAASADETAHALAMAGLGTFRRGETLFLKGDVDGRSGKDGRRAAIAARYCVVAMAGDQLSDFSDLFAGTTTERRALAHGSVRAFFGRSWFMLPNPVYGSGLGGEFDDVFPMNRRWVDPGATRGKK